jgi:organic radical activating enzyme
MKPFPIRVEKAIPISYKFIEWKIHNVCNHDCSFCNSKDKDGSNRWTTLEKYKQQTDKLVEICNGSPVWIQLTGGEPTLFPEVTDLLVYMKSKGVFTSMISNGTRTIRWWKEFVELHPLDQILITYHSEQTIDYKHIAEVANLFQDKPTEVIVLITHVSDSTNLAIEALDYLTEHTGAVMILKAMMIRNYDIYATYTPEQLLRIHAPYSLGKFNSTKVKSTVPQEHKINQQMKIEFNTGEIALTNTQTMLKNNETKFLGWECDFGRDFMRIDGNMTTRGVCSVGSMTHIDDPKLSFTTDFITCTQEMCFCSTDIFTTKRLPGTK